MWGAIIQQGRLKFSDGLGRFFRVNPMQNISICL